MLQFSRLKLFMGENIMSTEELMRKYEEQSSKNNQEQSSYLCYSDYDD